MIAKVRNLKSVFSQSHETKFKKLLVSGGSFVWNNSEEHICTWPYYLRDLSGFQEVYDCSQSGAGPGHVFNSIINEIETNSSISPKDTLIILMFSDLSTVDTISTPDITRPWHPMSNYNFNDQFSSLTLFRGPFTNKSNSLLQKLCIDYAKHIDPDAQSYENLLKIKALNSYLRDKGFTKIFLNWKEPESKDLLSYLDKIQCLDDYTQEHDMRIPGDGHPTPDAHLQWTREHLIPYLVNQGLVNEIHSD